MSDPSWLIDKSALARLGASPQAAQWADRIHRGLVHVAAATLLEVGYSARSAQGMDRALSSPALSAMPVEYSTPAIEDRAMTMQRWLGQGGRLAQLGQHRAPSIPDLLIAATAELSNRIVLHVDKDFELIADLTNQPVERLIM